jgi:hypothetical protein
MVTTEQLGLAILVAVVASSLLLGSACGALVAVLLRLPYGWRTLIADTGLAFSGLVLVFIVGLIHLRFTHWSGSLAGWALAAAACLPVIRHAAQKLAQRRQWRRHREIGTGTCE